MAHESDIDWDFLWMKLSERFVLGSASVHGPSHWRRVEANGRRLVNATPGADLVVVRLFAVFHDAERWDEASDIAHGSRAARLVESVHGTWFPASEDQLLLLSEACEQHADGTCSDDPTIGCCWDADRLDLPRVGISPHREFMSTPTGRNLAHW